MFHGYAGFIQADAKSAYDLLFRQAEGTVAEGGGPEEVGCWAHCRRKFYEAAIAKDRVAREASFRIGRLFENEKAWAKEPPARRKALRLQLTKPLLDDFFAWADIEYDKVRDQRGLLRSAFGYAVRQRGALCRFVDDGRLRIDNNGSERALRQIAVGRKAWLFVGSDDHAEAAANLFSLIASCKRHRLDPDADLCDLFRVLVHWPNDRYLELAPSIGPRPARDSTPKSSRFSARVVRTVNSEMVLSYWHIGREIVEHVQRGEARAEYGKEVLEGLSRQLLTRVGKGYSARNLWYFRDFYVTYRDRTPKVRAERFRTSLVQNSKSDDAAKILHEAGAELAEGFSSRLSWTHYRALLAVRDPAARAFYEIEAERENWSTPTSSARSLRRSTYVS